MNSLSNRLRSALIIAILLLSTTANVTAQTISPVIMAQVNAELQKRGLTESEVRVRLIQKGINLENIPPSELPAYQARVTAILDELQAEKKNQVPSTQPVNVNVGSVPSVNNETPSQSAATSPTLNTEVPVTTPQEATAEASQRAIQAISAKSGSSRIFGHSLFTDNSLDVFRTTDGAQAPDNYILDDGDEIRITIFGASQTDIQQKIASDGSIQPTGSSKIFLKGVSLSQAREIIRSRLSSVYTFRADQFAVTIVAARTIMVNVFGETKVTGSFTLSALNSAFNALSAAGGPTQIGSVRDIQLIRGNSRKNIDLYAFMSDPSIQFKFELQNNDILFVPVLKSLVTIEGAVNRPMSYEMLPNETLIDLIKFAGGFRMDVLPDFIQIKRFENGEQRLFEWNLEEVRSKKITIPLVNGDVVLIKSIGKPMDQYVDIEGSMYYPGRYDLSSNVTLKQLLTNSKPSFEAKTDVVFIERVRPDETIELLTVPFPSAQNNVPDFILKPRDRVRVTDQASYRDIATISVSGNVRLPFKKSFSLNDRLTAKQAIELAGGLKSSVYPVAYIFRQNIFNPVETKYIRVELDNCENVVLQPGDQLNIYDNTTYTNIGEVKVSGAVKTARGFTYDSTLTLPDVLINAGGFNVGAAFNKVEVFRTILSPTESAKLDLITLQVDSSFQIVSPQNFTLQPYDQIVVRMTPEFTMGRTVELSGQVKYPGVYLLESKQTKLSDVIEMAGGLLDDADPNGARLFRTFRNRGEITLNLKKAMRNSRNLTQNPILFEGDVININRLENTITILENGTRMAQYSVNFEGNSKKNVVYQGNKSAAWYVRNYAGGFKKDADRNSVTVTLPNNQMLSTKKVFGIFRNYPDVESGSAITIMMKPPEDPALKKEKKEVDWDTIFSRTLSATTSTLTLFLLVRQLAP